MAVIQRENEMGGKSCQRLVNFDSSAFRISRRPSCKTGRLQTVMQINISLIANTMELGTAQGLGQGTNYWRIGFLF